MTDRNGGTELTDRRTMLKAAAVTGLVGGAVPGSASAHPNRIEFRAATDAVFRYDVAVTGALKRIESDDGDELIGDDRVRGACAEGRADVFGFSGKIRRLELDGPGKVFVNGERVRDTTATKTRLPNAITIESKGRVVRYKFKVSERVEPTDNAGAPTDEVVDGTTVRGSVGSDIDGTDEADTYGYAGSIVFEEADGPLRVTLDLNDA